eukprot:sb/3469529/
MPGDPPQLVTHRGSHMSGELVTHRGSHMSGELVTHRGSHMSGELVTHRGSHMSGELVTHRGSHMSGELVTHRGSHMSGELVTHRGSHMSGELVTHRGSCHCGKVQFEVSAPAVLEVWHCNCSVCTKKQNHHFVVPEGRFKLLDGSAEFLTTYTFNTHRAKHTFCKVCGVQSFYKPRSNPDGIGVMPHCIDSDTIERMVIREFDGMDWEACIQGSDIVGQSSENNGGD